MAEPSSGRLGTLRAMVALCRARLLVAFVPFYRWRSSLGGISPAAFTQGRSTDGLDEALGLARQIEWAALRLPFATKCLPRAMALSWALRRSRIGHVMVLAARPAELRPAPDALHAWVEVDGIKVIGDLPGPWIETLRLGERSAGTAEAGAR